MNNAMNKTLDDILAEKLAAVENSRRIQMSDSSQTLVPTETLDSFLRFVRELFEIADLPELAVSDSLLSGSD